MKNLYRRIKLPFKLLGVTLVAITGLVAIFSTSPPNNTVDIYGTMTDQDGNVYKTVNIDGRWWMQENLRVTHYRNGDPIEKVDDLYVWVNRNTGAYCAYDLEEANADSFGYLYNFHAVRDDRHIAPEGWHVATDLEWKELEMHLGMSQADADGNDWRGTDEGEKLKSETGWSGDGNGTNASRFTALPAGMRNGSGVFSNLGSTAWFWTGTPVMGGGAWTRELSSANTGVRRQNNYVRLGQSVRLVRDY